MRPDRLAFLSATQLAAAFALFPSLEPPAEVRRYRDQRTRRAYHHAGQDVVLMDWDLPKGKRARRRARGKRAAFCPEKQSGAEK